MGSCDSYAGRKPGHSFAFTCSCSNGSKHWATFVTNSIITMVCQIFFSLILHEELTNNSIVVLGEARSLPTDKLRVFYISSNCAIYFIQQANYEVVQHISSPPNGFSILRVGMIADSGLRQKA
ncbi:uncharacterized protein [Henckelia pumila]|uniref:uncharacterized protein isoform X1 n=1 Tax=Henckelia pumila TaxID=405737 RepID=UPI003C6E8C69